MENPKIRVVNMIMIYEKDSDRVLALDKIHPDWGGITFPGGKCNPGESVIASVIREAKEETGLDIVDPKPCGIVHWACENGDRYLEFLFRTCSFSGCLCDGTHEGKVFWTTRKELLSSKNLSLNFAYYLPMFFENRYTEAFFPWDGKAWEGKPIYM